MTRSRRALVWRCLRALSVLALAALPSVPARSEVFRVDQAAGTDAPGCGSVGAPCESIQQAVNLAASGDELRVATGTYLYEPTLDPCGGETGVVCIVDKALAIHGGYDGSDWTSADPLLNPTVIDGENVRRALLATKSFPEAAGAAALTLSGFTLRRGLAVGDPDAEGGCLKAGLLETLDLSRVEFEECVAEGADTSSGAGGAGVGGGLYVSTAIPALPVTEVRLDQLTFVDCRAVGGDTTDDERGGFAEGGGAFVSRAELVATDLTFTGNSAVAGASDGDGLTGGVRSEALGGGLAILRDTTGSLDLASFTNNLAEGGSASTSTGTGGTASGGGLYLEATTFEVRSSTVRDNSVIGGAGATGGLGAGGGIGVFDVSLTLDRCEVIANTSTGGTGSTTKGSAGGGGLYFERFVETEATVTVSNSVFAANRVELGSGPGTVGGGGGGVQVLGAEATFIHTTFAGNELAASPMVGQAIVVVPRAAVAAHATIRDSIVADHTSLAGVAAVQAQSTSSSVLFERGLFAGNSLSTNDGKPNAGAFSGLSTMDDAVDAGFVSPGPPDHDHHLTAGSAARDVAVESVTVLDLDGAVRGAPRDYGADEYCTSADEELMLTNGAVETGTTAHSACRSIVAGPYRVGASGQVDFQAGIRVVLQDGFTIDAASGRVTFRIELP